MMLYVALMLAALVCHVRAGTIVAANKIAIVGFEPNNSPVSCQAPALYLIGEQTTTDNLVGVWFTFDDPVATASPRWISSIAARHSTCRFKFGGSNDDNSNGASTTTAVNCATATTGACRRCHMIGPCVCGKLAAGATQGTVSLWWRYSWQDANNNNQLEESTVQGPVSIPVAVEGKPGCPVDWSMANPLQQLAAIPTFNQAG